MILFTPDPISQWVGKVKQFLMICEPDFEFIQVFWENFGRYCLLDLKLKISSPRWPLENPPPVAGSKSPTLRQQNGCKLIQFLF